MIYRTDLLVCPCKASCKTGSVHNNVGRPWSQSCGGPKFRASTLYRYFWLIEAARISSTAQMAISSYTESPPEPVNSDSVAITFLRSSTKLIRTSSLLWEATKWYTSHLLDNDSKRRWEWNKDLPCMLHLPNTCYKKFTLQLIYCQAGQIINTAQNRHKKLLLPKFHQLK